MQDAAQVQSPIDHHPENINTDTESQLLPPRREAPPKKARLISLDVLRGLTMVGMLLTINMGDRQYVIWPLAESDWDGLSIGDIIFPSFLFIMGLAISLTFKQQDRFKGRIWYKIFKRAILLFLIGSGLNTLIGKLFTMSTDSIRWRIMGVLQRISLCYLIVSSSYLCFRKIQYHAIFLASCLAIYIGFMFGYPLDFNILYDTSFRQCKGRGILTKICNFCGYFDRAIFGSSSRWMTYPNDPEGIFSTLSSLINVYAGLSFGIMIRWKEQQLASTNMVLKLMEGNIKTTLLMRVLVLMSSALAIIGGIFFLFDPVCKNRWSVSFAFFTSSISAFAFIVFFYLLDINNKPFLKETLFQPFLWLGMNPLIIFVAMTLFDNLLINFSQISRTEHLYYIIYQSLFTTIGNEYVASIMVSILNLALWMLVAFILYRKKIFIKL
ncbi:hypothetical protein FGO68_gene11823 [Halteria grandinella]|uniref:DUF5009 domain-containing protein n=1 Tax=Halteria grandinella TaxID=5974 RepID=A0A8J8NNI9_HALGN|nr:hypothetical protein FGO68_gene11823 [Halteria grandinella]